MTATTDGYRIASMRNNRKTIYLIICVLLCLAVCMTMLRTCSNKTAAGSFHMLDFNDGLEESLRDDDYRTTYEIFVYSFCDSDGDGIGDLNGIRSRLDYIEDLGFDALWLTPVHPSSTYHKYDVDDYYAIDPEFGTMEDYEALLKECHDRGVKVYMDLVLNHTSDDNAWFKAASDYLHELPSGWEPDPSYCKYYDYYNFSRQPAEGYTYLEGTEWYYESGFWSEMPELNLSSEAVRREIRDIMAFWLDQGVDGFRLDAVTSYYKDDIAANTDFLRFLKETGISIDQDCYFAGEAWTDRDTIAALYTSGIDSLFDFPFSGNGGCIANTLNGNISAADYVREMMAAEETYAAANHDYVDAPFYTNHDMDRSAEYYPDESGAAVKMAYAMDLLMTGNAFVYYGEELGMGGSCRDENRRAPMYWSDEAGDPGMCSGPPGMDIVHMRFPSAAEQMKDDMSVHRWFTEAIRVRKAFPAIARGKTENLEGVTDDTTAAFFRRCDNEDDVLIVMNLSAQTVEKDLGSAADGFAPAAVLNTGGEHITYSDGGLSLPGYSIAVFKEDI